MPGRILAVHCAKVHDSVGVESVHNISVMWMAANNYVFATSGMDLNPGMKIVVPV